MSGNDDDQDYFKRACDRRRGAVEAGYPSFVYSYSSRISRYFANLYCSTSAINPRPLVSLLDIQHYLGDSAYQRPPIPGLFFDSGNYEVGVTTDDWMPVGPPSEVNWTPAAYLNIAKQVIAPGDTLISFDDPNLPLNEQAEVGLSLFSQLSTSDYRKDLLLHVHHSSPQDVAKVVQHHAAGIDVVGLTEKDIGLPWFVGAGFVRALRDALDRNMDRYVPIHIFGCLDPFNVPYLFFAGADIFDGLGWLRYYFHDGHTYYAREFEHDAPLETLADFATSGTALAAHNIAEMERLQSDLRYAVLGADAERFASCLRELRDLQRTA